MAASKRVLINCDPGIDDALALLFAFASPEIRVEAITTSYGNVALSKTLDNLLKILHISSVTPMPDVGRGCKSPLKGDGPGERGVHGIDGLADTGLGAGGVTVDVKDGVDLIIDKALNGSIDSIIALSPLTNIASAVLKEPRIKGHIKELIIMGGVLYPSGSFTSEIEFNIGCDPDAARQVFNSTIPIKLVSLDTTRKVVLKEEHLESFKEIGNPLSEFILKITKFFIDYNKNVRKREGAFLNDPLAVGVAVYERLFSFEDVCIDVELKGDRGKIFLKEDKPNISFCKDVRSEEFINLFITRLLNYCKG